MNINNIKDTESEYQNKWKYLEKPILIEISNYISCLQLRKLSWVCSRWSNILKHRQWRIIDYEFEPIEHKIKLLKKYGNFVKYINPSIVYYIEKHAPDWLDNCPSLWFYYFTKIYQFCRHDSKELIIQKLPKSLPLVPIYNINCDECLDIILELVSLKSPSVIKGYSIKLEDAPVTRLLNMPSNLRLSLNRLEIQVMHDFNIERVAELLNSLENLRYFRIHDFPRYEIPDKWEKVDILVHNLGKIRELKISTKHKNYKSLYTKNIRPDLSIKFKTSLTSIDFSFFHLHSHRRAIKYMGESADLNIFDYLILNSPLLTHIYIASIDSNLLSIISRSCPNLADLYCQTPLPVFEHNVSIFNNLKRLSVSSLDNFNSEIGANFNTIFPQVTGLYLDHYFTHEFKRCKGQELPPIDILFPKLVSLKLSHDISEFTLESLLSRPGNLNLTHLYLHSHISSWKNLIELINQKCPNLQSITCDSSSKSKPFKDSPLTVLKSTLPNIDFISARFVRPFEYSIVYI